MTAAFDNTMLSTMLNPNGNIPVDPSTGLPVEEAKARTDSVVQKFQKSRRKIVIPSPACAELLTAIGPDAQQYINIMTNSRVFEIGSFDARGATELAILNRSTFKDDDAKNTLEPYQKIKTDRQIIAICKVYGATELYTDDSGLAKRARLCGITPIGVANIPIPDSARQHELKLEPHEEIAGGADDPE